MSAQLLRSSYTRSCVSGHYKTHAAEGAHSADQVQFLKSFMKLFSARRSGVENRAGSAMEKDNYELSADFSDDISVESILAEYNANKSVGDLDIKPEREVSRSIEFKSDENGALEASELDSRVYDSELGDLSFPSDLSESPGLSRLLSQIKNEQSAKAENATPDNILLHPAAAKGLSAEIEDAVLIDNLLADKINKYSGMGEDFPPQSTSELPEMKPFAGKSAKDFNAITNEEPSAIKAEDYAKAFDGEDSSEYADSGDYEPDEKSRLRTAEKPDLKERLLYPLIGIITYSASKREKRRLEAQARRDALPKEEVPELEPTKAAMLYAQQSESLKLRCYFATGLTAILIYLSYGLPTPGLLGSNHTVRALVCIIFELSVMIVGLDIFTNGILSLIRKKPGAESLISLSAIVTAIGALHIAISGNSDLGLPFCGVSALSMTFALWGEKLSCDNFAVSFYTAGQAKNPSVIVSEAGIDDEGCALAKVARPVTGFVRTAEASDIFEGSYKLLAPIFIVAAIVLSLFCSLASSSKPNFMHTLGASISITASLSAFLGFSLPFSVSAKRLAQSGVAIAGYSGCAEIGSNRRVIITDTDIFPPRAISIGDISIAEDVNPQKAISYTGSMVSAAGLGIAPVFTQLMRKNGCVMQKVEDFACHEGGGIIARINGETVYVGTVSFMQLMGVRIPRNTAIRTTVYTAINDVLAGYFSMEYTAMASVQRALVSLLSGSGEPVFAIRDFNITPMLLKQKFRLPTGNYDFPSFADRYRISASEFEETGTVAAMFTRGSLNSFAGLCKRGRRLYISLRIIAALSVIGSVIGMALMLALCWNAAYASASCGNIITYMLLWLVPVLVISFGLRR